MGNCQGGVVALSGVWSPDQNVGDCQGMPILDCLDSGTRDTRLGDHGVCSNAVGRISFSSQINCLSAESKT